MTKDIEVYLTAFNEAESISSTIDICIQELKKIGYSYSIKVVDNGSTDQTKEIVQTRFASNPKIQFIGLEKNYGYSISVLQSISMCRSEYCIVMDADGQFSPSYLENFISQINGGADLVLGARTKRIGDIRRKIGSYVFLFLARKMIGFDGPDLNVGMRAISKKHRRVLLGAQAGRLANPNIWFQARNAGLTISYVSVEPNSRKAGKSSLPWSSPMRLMNESIQELNRIKKRDYAYYVKGEF